MHLRARQYNPTVGRFTTVDPVQPGEPGTTGYHLYSYAANNPTTFTDPTGQAVLVEYGSIGARVGAVVGFGVGSFVCADGESRLGGQEARCVLAYTVGGAAFGGVAPAAGLGPGASCAVGGALGALEGVGVTYAAGQDGAVLGGVVGGGLGCGLGAVAAKLRQVVDTIAERSAAGLIPYIDAPRPTQIDQVVPVRTGPVATNAGAPLTFGASDLVYGPSAGGQLRQLANESGGQLLTDLPKPTDLTFTEFSLRTLDEAASSGRPVHFDLSNVQDLDGALAGTGEFADTVTSAELRHICGNAARFASNVNFYSAGQLVPMQSVC